MDVQSVLVSHRTPAQHSRTQENDLKLMKNNIKVKTHILLVILQTITRLADSLENA
jgi:hypothetical protein